MKDIYGEELWEGDPLHPIDNGHIFNDSELETIQSRFEWLPYSEELLISIHEKDEGMKITTLTIDETKKLINVLQEMIDGKHDYEY